MTPERRERLRSVAYRRQFDLTVILENVNDPHNIAAVLRSCDSVGLREIFVLYNNPRLKIDRLEMGKRSSAGARRWVDIRFYTDTRACMVEVKSKYDKIYSTHLDSTAASVYDLDLTQRVALLFGNEQVGITSEAQSYADGNFLVPQMGMVQSLNISVACAVTLYEAYRQRHRKGFYGAHNRATPEEKEALFEHFIQRHEDRASGAYVDPLDR